MYWRPEDGRDGIRSWIKKASGSKQQCNPTQLFTFYTNFVRIEVLQKILEWSGAKGYNG